MMESRKAQISAVAALDEPIRRRLYDYVVRQPRPVSRDDAAAGLQLPRTTAAFHLDRLVDESLRVLQAHGFEPRIEGGEITLVNCPFHTLAQDYTETRLRNEPAPAQWAPRRPSPHRTDRPPEPRPTSLLRPPPTRRPRIRCAVTLTERSPR